MNKPQLKSSAYLLAEKEVCADCICYQHGVCPCPDGQKDKCKYFHYTYQHHYFEKVTAACRKDKGLRKCSDCDDAMCCTKISDFK